MSEGQNKYQTSSAGTTEKFSAYESNGHKAILPTKSEDWLIYFVYQHFFRPPSLKDLILVLCFIFGLVLLFLKF